MLDAVSGSEMVVAAVTMLVGSTVFSTLGFGIGMTTTPFLLLLFEPQTVVVMVNTVTILLLLLIIRQTRAVLPFREMAGVSVAGLLAVPVGVFFLSSATSTTLRVSITALILALAVLTLFNRRIRLPKPGLVGLSLGFVVSLLLTSLGIGGPLMVLFLLTREWTRDAIRGGLALYFLVVEGAAVIGYGVAGLFTAERVVLILIVIAPVLVGFGIAAMVVRRMNERIFRHAVVGFIMVTSVMVLAREVSSII